MKLPRLAGALRAFSSVVRSTDEEEEETASLEEKRHFQLQRKSKEYLSWDEFSSFVLDSVPTNSKDKIVNHLRELKMITCELAGKESSWELVEVSVIYLFHLFQDADIVTNHHIISLKQIFGSYSLNRSLVDKACRIVKNLVAELPESAQQYIISSKREKSSNSLQDEFGKNIKFVPPRLANSLQDLEWQLNNFSYTDIPSEGFNLKYDSYQSVDSFDSQTLQPTTQAFKFDLNWLENQVKLYFTDHNSTSVQDLVMSAYNLLCSSKSDEELQNELFELLGFDKFELLKSLFEHRQALISSSSIKTEVSQSSQSDSLKFDQRPAFGCQVTIQTGLEKQIRKQARKDDKKLQRNVNRLQDTDDDDDLAFDPQNLRRQREATLITAMQAPIFPIKSVDTPKVTYPHVYDIYAEAKMSAGYIGGLKMLLPAGFERFNNKQCEEVVIPPSNPPPINIGRKLKPVSELDEIGQIVFKGVKNLNRIQSVVFETAYHTNENLLICAPTGAGKTNIAMLTIVHEIKQHFEDGIIKKNNFKIVYVAPMKALAAEMVRNFHRRLESLGLSVRELTGDMQLTKSEIVQTQVIVTTPEKWDVVTRKGMGDVALTQLVRLLIIDEVHLLHGDRGPVVEALVARTLRQVESTQSMIRIVGLSATLPNYLDVAQFLNVSPFKGLFFFDSRFRPVPLAQTFIGVKATNPLQQLQDMDTICYEKVLDKVRNGHQVMVFVHARNATVRTASILRDLSKNGGHSKFFEAQQSSEFGHALKQVMLSRNKPLKELFPSGFSIHHAGMLRQDRTLVERLFSEGFIKVLVCTATLAWGVNLPAHAVIIKGTDIYDAKHGSFVNLGILDVMQIFGRAGRPQFDKSGHGTIITPHDKLSYYLSLLTSQYPIESNFIQCLADNLNAEIALGTVTNVEEAIQWLSYTYLFVRMRCNPQAYGIKYQIVKDDPNLLDHRKELITSAARHLDKAFMVRFDEKTGNLHSTDLGRTASHYYIKYDTVEIINENLKTVMNEADILSMVSNAQEFEQIKVREDEMEELAIHEGDSCWLPVKGGKENPFGKVNILIQTHISRRSCDSFSLVSDQSYVIQNATRIIRALFEVVLRKNWALMASRLLRMSKMIERQLWDSENPLRQFPILGPEILSKIENKNLSIERLKEMDSKEIGFFVHHQKMGKNIKQCVESLPSLILDATIQPITRNILRVRLSVTPDFYWNDKLHGGGCESFWIWVEDPDSNRLHHHEYFLLTKKQVVKKETQFLVFTIPVSEPLPTQYYVRATSDRWLGSESVIPLSFQHLILPERHPPHTELLDLQPLPVSVLGNSHLEKLYNFSHFNPIQTQIFHTLYHTDSNILLGAPTGSGKTIVAEIAMFRVFREYPGTKVVYIAPLKALVRERINDWKVRLEQKVGKSVIELTGDVTPDARAIAMADVIVTTPEKWDGISRSWQTRNYVKSVSLIVIDEIHLLGEDRGPVLEVIVSRTNFISSHTDFPLRIIGLSTALANARDLGDWLGIKELGLFNFRPSVRPVPLEVHIEGFPGKHYCPRMATMNKPTFQAICIHSPTKPVLIFVSSRRQTRLTALDLIAFLAAADNPKQWLHMPEEEIDNVISGIKDINLKLTLAFGIGIHHAGLHERDRRTVEELFVNQKIQVLVATATLAWGVNFPAHLVVVKGTEYYDGKTKRYVDFPVTDVLQMIGRAGRPQFDDQGVAVLLVHDVKKNFYKKFIYDPFPVESSLLAVLPDHLNAEIVAGTITSKQDAVDYITWTYFFRRLIQNPSFYQLEDISHDSMNKFLSGLIERSLNTLIQAYCIEIGEDNRSVQSTTLGRVASYYYLNYDSVRHFREKMNGTQTTEQLLDILSNVHEYEELPVRHNEDSMNSDLAKACPVEVNAYTFDSPHTKTNLLFQAHFSRLQLPCTDYYTDLKSVLDQAIRILQAMLDVAADQGWLSTSIQVANMIQMVLQGRWIKDNSLLTLPHIETHNLYCFRKGVKLKKTNKSSGPIDSLPQLIACCHQSFESLASMLRQELEENQIEQIFQVLNQLPVIQVKLSIKGWWENSSCQEDKKVPINSSVGIRPEEDWIQVHTDQEYILSVNLTRLSKRKQDSRAIAPRFPKSKDEGWFLILGDIENQELLALKRVSCVQRNSNCQIMFYTPEETGRVIYTLYILSDSYIGLDQQYDICLEVIPSSIEAQVNTEVLDDEEEDFVEEFETAKHKTEKLYS